MCSYIHMISLRQKLCTAQGGNSSLLPAFKVVLSQFFFLLNKTGSVLPVVGSFAFCTVYNLPALRFVVTFITSRKNCDAFGTCGIWILYSKPRALTSAALRRLVSWWHTEGWKWKTLKQQRVGSAYARIRLLIQPIFLPPVLIASAAWVQTPPVLSSGVTFLVLLLLVVPRLSVWMQTWSSFYVGPTSYVGLLVPCDLPTPPVCSPCHT